MCQQNMYELKMYLIQKEYLPLIESNLTHLYPQNSPLFALKTLRLYNT